MSDIHKINEVVKITNPVTVTGTVTVDTSLLAKETGGNLAAIKAKTDNLDAALSTRLKPADTLAGVTTVGSITNPVAITNANLDAKLSDIKAKTDNLDATISSLVTAVNTLLKPANTLTKVATVDTITNAVPVANGVGVKIYDETSATYKGLMFHAEAPHICAQPYLQAMAEGDIAGHTPVFKVGVNPDVDDTQEDIWEVGANYVFPTSAMGMEVVSSSASDTAAGTGIRKIRIYYLDGTFHEKSEEITLNGTGVVATVATDIYRIQYVEATDVGSNGSAVGTIDVRHLADTPIYGRISLGYTKSRQLIYTVPFGKTLYIAQLTCGAICTGTNGARFILRATYSHLASSLRNFFLPHGEVCAENGSVSMALEIPESFPAGTDVKVSVIGTSASANITATVGIRGWLE